MNSSPERGQFRINCELKCVEEGRKTAEEAQEMIEYYKKWQDETKEKEQSPEWQKNNMEYDLRSAKWICDKVKASDSYAQNLYAAMCNNDFAKNDVWPLLTGETWGCSWRYAGGIIADMQEKGDYIDWYCSGIRHQVTDEEFNQMDKAEQERYMQSTINYVSESHVTDEIKEDLLKLGWLVVENSEE